MTVVNIVGGALFSYAVLLFSYAVPRAFMYISRF
jgi:hypothetical protein